MSIYHKHHIVPRHMGGSDDPSNLVELTIEEHAEAHLRLWEEHGSEYDLIAYRGLSGRIGKEEIIRQVQKKYWEDFRSDPEARKKLSEVRSDPEARKKHSEAAKKRFSNPEARKKTSETTKKAWSNPKTRKKMIESRTDPEYRKKLSDAAKKRWAAYRARA